MQQTELSAKIIQSEIRNMSIECDKVKGINLSQGFSDIEIQNAICEGAKRAIDDGHNHYTRFDGIVELREALSNKLRSYNKIEADPETEIIVTSGSTAALFCVFYALFKPGDEIVVFEPYYGYHLNTIFAVNLAPNYVALDAPTWAIDFDILEKQITSKTKAILLNTPVNPSGKIFSREEILKIGELAEKYNLLIITDEIYEYFLYDDNRHISPASIDSIKKRVITIGGYSKTFSITGWRIGYIVCNREISHIIGFVHDLIYVCAPAPLQAGVVEGIRKLNDSFYTNLQLIYRTKRNIICEALKKSGLFPIVPQGAYYVLADISILPGNSSKEKVMALLKRTKVAAVPGVAFFHDKRGENLARFCFAKRDEVLLDAAERLMNNIF